MTTKIIGATVQEDGTVACVISVRDADDSEMRRTHLMFLKNGGVRRDNGAAIGDQPAPQSVLNAATALIHAAEQAVTGLGVEL